MIPEPYIFLSLILLIAMLAKNKSLIIAVIVLIILKLIASDTNIFSQIKIRGIEWGVTIITIAVLVPIATGEIGFKDLGAAFRSPLAWISLTSGVMVALLAKGGVTLLAQEPHVTTALVFGTILAVSLFNGIAVGPLIGAGIAFVAMRIFEFIR